MVECPNCKNLIEDDSKQCLYCKTNFDEEKTYENDKKDFSNADILNIFSYVGLIITIIVGIILSIDAFIQDRFNLYFLLGGISILFSGFILFFLLKTIVDIYDKIEG